MIVAHHTTNDDDQADPTFKQLLGINNDGVIAGYFGSGMPAGTHPNKGYTLDLPYGQGNYVNENFPGSRQTQVTGINDKGTTVGLLGRRQRQQPRLPLQRPQEVVHRAPHPRVRQRDADRDQQ